MNTQDNIIRAEIQDVAQIVYAACAAESALRGASVNPHDPGVQVRAADIILNGAGAHIRELRSRQFSRPV